MPIPIHTPFSPLSPTRRKHRKNETPCTQRICHLSLSLCTLTLATLAACGGPRRDKTAPFALSLSHLATPICTSRAHVKKAPGPLMCECWVCYLVLPYNTDLMEIGAGTGRTPGQRGGINRFQRDRSEIDRRRCVSVDLDSYTTPLATASGISPSTSSCTWAPWGRADLSHP